MSKKPPAQVDLFGQQLDEPPVPKQTKKPANVPVAEHSAGSMFMARVRPFVAVKDASDKWATWLLHD